METYLDAPTSPRRNPLGDVEQLPLARRCGEAFCALLGNLPVDGLPQHGGTATTVMVMLDLDTLKTETGDAETRSARRWPFATAGAQATKSPAQPVYRLTEIPGGDVGTEPEGFREFVVARSPALLRTAWMLTGNAAVAEDLLQTALARTWPHWRRVVDGQPEAYVRKVMVRTNASWRARRWIGETPTADVPAVGSEQADEGRVDDRLALMSALAALPVRQRQAVVLRYFDDLSVKAVAEIMASSPGTVKSQSAKGLAKLRAALADDEERVEKA